MSVVSGKFYPVGLRYAAIMALNAAGLPAATSGSPYSGIELEGPKTFNVNEGAPRKITHVGKDGVQSTDSLPTQEGTTAELNASDYRFDIHEMITGTKVRTIGEAKQIVHGTDKSGSEPDVALHLYQQGNDLNTGQRIWRSFIFPKAICVKVNPGAGDSPIDVKYNVTPKRTTKALWGEVLTLLNDGATRKDYAEYMTENRPRMAAWLSPSSGSDLEFLFDDDHQAASAAKVDLVAVNGVVKSGSAVTKATDGVTLHETLAENDLVVAFYEEAD